MGKQSAAASDERSAPLSTLLRYCPDCGHAVLPTEAMISARPAGSDAEVTCPECGASRPLGRMSTTPPLSSRQWLFLLSAVCVPLPLVSACTVVAERLLSGPSGALLNSGAAFGIGLFAIFVCFQMAFWAEGKRSSGRPNIGRVVGLGCLLAPVALVAHVVAVGAAIGFCALVLR